MYELLRVIATAYCLTGTTATGTQVRSGTVAVDPRIIPLGTKLLVSGYGRSRAEDTGSAIKGRRIDVWFRSCADARRWGVRRIRIQVRR